jgi:hypothetical protein
MTDHADTEDLKDEQDLLARLTVYVAETARTVQALAEVVKDTELHDKLDDLREQTVTTMQWAVDRFGEVQKRLREEDDDASE